MTPSAAPGPGVSAGHTAGFVVWLTGFSGAGKTTLAGLIASEIERRGAVVDTLDGEVVRSHLSRELGFSKADRDLNIERIGWVASRLARAGAAVVVSAISPYDDERRRARAMVEEFAPFVCIHVATPLEECMRRDPKGLYARALAGEIEEFTGISSPYEEPRDPELRLDTVGRQADESAGVVVALLERLGLVSPTRRERRDSNLRPPA